MADKNAKQASKQVHKQTELTYLSGKPESTGLLRSEPADFKVFELSTTLPSGDGEHLYIYLRKTGLNTVFVARQLAKFFKVKDSLVTYAGLKDKFAVTEQWFGVHLPGKADSSKAEIDTTSLNLAGVEILKVQRHNKKLKIGNLIGNRFELTLREISNAADIERRWQQIRHSGVPNYFGEQRFGHNGNNLTMAKALFNGQKVKDKKKRGMYLSAARSEVFNQVVSKRVANGLFSTLNVGDVCMLAGSQSIFAVEQASDIDQTLTQRLASGDIDITAPMWGKGELRTANDIAELEQAIANKNKELCQGLCDFGLKQERRRIRLMPEQGQLKVDGDTAVISFVLPAGAYATTVLRELLQYQDISEPTNQGN